MKTLFRKKSIITLFAASAMLFGCDKEDPISEELNRTKKEASEELSKVIQKLEAAGFDTSEGFRKFEDGYLVEYDIYLTKDMIEKLEPYNPKERGPITEHYRTNNLVTPTPRIIKVFMDTRFGTYMQNSMDGALLRYNALNIGLKFERTTSSTAADISILSFTEDSNTLGISAGFPTGGNPATPIRLNTVYYNNSQQRPDATTTIAHEIGHAIGFRHTDYMNRTFSCGSGGIVNEGALDVGAVYIPGTPTGGSANSWMLACSNNTDRPFTNTDVIALTKTYPGAVSPLHLAGIAKNSTGTSNVELHVATAASGFNSFAFQGATAFPLSNDQWEFTVVDWDKDGKLDLAGVKKSGTSTSKVELRVATAASGFSSYAFQGTTAFPVSNDQWEFDLTNLNF